VVVSACGLKIGEPPAAAGWGSAAGWLAALEKIGEESGAGVGVCATAGTPAGNNPATIATSAHRRIHLLIILFIGSP
jgi:hypothetical protein